jgi:hypothetical protein
METIIIHPKNNEQIKLFEQMAKELRIPFETKKSRKASEREKAITHYGKDFVEMIEKGDQEIKAGKYKVIKTGDLWK